jgi:hypothetical protein
VAILKLWQGNLARLENCILAVRDRSRVHSEAAISKAVEATEITIGCSGSPKKPAPGEPYVRAVEKMEERNVRKEKDHWKAG